MTPTSTPSAVDIRRSRETNDDHNDFQCACGPLTLCGCIECVLISDGCPPGDIVKAGQPFEVSVKWDVWGTVLPWMGGTFYIHVDFECIGDPAGDLKMPPVAVPLDSVKPSGTPPRAQYSKNIPENSGKLLPGTYLVSIYITYNDPYGDPGPIAGMSPEHFIQVMP